MITGYLHYGSKEDVESRGVDAIQEYYVKFNQEVENNPELMDEARSWFKRIEDQDPEALKIYDWFIDISIEEAKRIYKLLNITFDDWTGEAYYNDKMGPVITELENSGLLQTSEGAKVVDLEKYNLGTCLILKSDGSSLYATRDLATALDRYERYRFDLGLYVTSVQQKLHFARWFKVLDLMGKDYAKNLKHITYGTYSLPTGKIGSRFGKQALVKDMIELSIDKAREIVTTRGTKVEDVEALSRDIGIGAVKFGVLKTERIKDCVFDLEASLNFDGETSPYLQYTHARCCSIIEKANNLTCIDNVEDINTTESFELIKHINDFDRIVIQSAEDYEPCYISRYLITLSSLFNKFYNNNRIIDNDRVSFARLKIVELVKDKLARGLGLLGIEAPTAM
jgi:arginyl-tRNA synthetase